MDGEIAATAEGRITALRVHVLADRGDPAGAYLSINLTGLRSGAEAASDPAMTEFTPAIWFTLTPDGKVTMQIIKAEMGQHIGTALAQVIAEELEVDWQDVRLDAPLESVENFAIYGVAATANSASVTTEFDRLSRAGAAGRMALVEAGAKLLGADPAACYAQRGRVLDRGSGRSIGYGEIIREVRIDRRSYIPTISERSRSRNRAATD